MPTASPLWHILLDMDGVLCNFFDAALTLHRAADRQHHWPPGQRDIAPVLGMSPGVFWTAIDTTPGFWATLKPYPWKDRLLRVAREHGRVTIATAPSMGENCASEKVQWMREHVAPGFTDYMIGRSKWLMAGPQTVLIDDSDRNIDEFRAHGGHGILFPQIWNSLHHVTDPFPYVLQELQQLTVATSLSNLEPRRAPA